MPEAGEEQTQAPKESASKTRMIIWIGIILAFVLIVGVFARMLIFPPGPQLPQVSENENPAEESPAPASEPGKYAELGDFLTNLAAPDDDFFISVEISVEIDPTSTKNQDKVLQEIENRSIEIKQIVEEVLRSRNREHLAEEEGREGMRKEIVRKINSVLTTGKIKNAYTYSMITSS